MVHDRPKPDKKQYDRNRYIRLKAIREAARPPDPISLLDEPTRAYIAGIVDGEGSIFAAAVGPKRRRTVYPVVVVAMTHRGVIDWLRQTMGTGTVKLHGKPQFEHYKQQYRIELFGKRAQLLCRVLLPYLKVKDRQAHLVLEFPVDARIAPGKKIEHSDINAVRYALRDKINALNH